MHFLTLSLTGLHDVYLDFCSMIVSECKCNLASECTD